MSDRPKEPGGIPDDEEELRHLAVGDLKGATGHVVFRRGSSSAAAYLQLHLRRGHAGTATRFLALILTILRGLLGRFSRRLRSRHTTILAHDEIGERRTARRLAGCGPGA